MARELPIHNGRMTTDLDANGFKIKNLPPGSGFTQAQADWGQTDATAPDFIKNKPTIPSAVSVDQTLTVEGAAADAKAVGDALRSGFTEWVCNEVTDGYEFVSCEWVKDQNMTDYAWKVRFVRTDLPLPLPLSVVIDGPKYDAVSLSSSDSTVSFSLSRNIITPTKTSQLENDGAPNCGGNEYVMTNDTRLSDARTPTAHHATHAANGSDPLAPADIGAAAASDLPYRLVEPGKWEFSGSGYDPTKTYDVNEIDGGEYYSYDLIENGTIIESLIDYSTEQVLSVEFIVESSSLIATRASLPGHLCDRAGNRVEVEGDTTLTLPAANPGYLRDFLVRLEISGSTVSAITFSPDGNESVTYETDGDEFPVPDEAGDWLYSFTESCVAHKFAVSLKKVNEVAQAAQGGA